MIFVWNVYEFWPMGEFFKLGIKKGIVPDQPLFAASYFKGSVGKPIETQRSTTKTL